MSTRFEQILKLFLSPLLSTFKLYNTQPNLQQKSAMVWQGFMLQVRLQRFFCKSERKFNFCPPFLCKNVKNWNCICKWDFFKSQTQFDFLAAIVLLLFCCWDFLLIERWQEKNYIQIYLKVVYFLNEFMKSSFLPKYEQKNGFLPWVVRAEILTIFGRNDDFINSFWN